MTALCIGTLGQRFELDIPEVMRTWRRAVRHPLSARIYEELDPSKRCFDVEEFRFCARLWSSGQRVYCAAGWDVKEIRFVRFISDRFSPSDPDIRQDLIDEVDRFMLRECPAAFELDSRVIEVPLTPEETREYPPCRKLRAQRLVAVNESAGQTVTRKTGG